MTKLAVLTRQSCRVVAIQTIATTHRSLIYRSAKHCQAGYLVVAGSTDGHSVQSFGPVEYIHTGLRSAVWQATFAIGALVAVQQQPTASMTLAEYHQKKNMSE